MVPLLGQIIDLGNEFLIGMEETDHQRMQTSWIDYSSYWFPIITTDGKNLNYKSFRIDRIGGTLHLENYGKIPFSKEKIVPEDILFGPLFFYDTIIITFKDETKAKSLILDLTTNFCFKEFHTGKGCKICNSPFFIRSFCN